MRTTVDLPPYVHQRAMAIAKERGQSLSATIAELTVRGLGQMDEPIAIRVDGRSGFPVISLSDQPITAETVADLLDED